MVERARSGSPVAREESRRNGALAAALAALARAAVSRLMAGRVLAATAGLNWRQVALRIGVAVAAALGAVVALTLIARGVEFAVSIYRVSKVYDVSPLEVLRALVFALRYQRGIGQRVLPA